MTADGTTTLPVAITLADPLFVATTAPVRRRVEDELSAVLRELGLDAVPAVEFRADRSPRRGQLISVEVAGRRCRLPRRTLPEALAYVEGTPLVAENLDAAAILDRLGGPDAAGTGRLGELVGLVGRAAVSAQPDVLRPDDVVAPALALGLAVTDHHRAAVLDVLPDGPIEALLGDLAARTISLIVEPEYFRALTLDGRGAELFPYMRDGLFVELGLKHPPLHVRQDPSLRHGGFAFGFNAVRSTPRIGLAPDTILVNDTAERLRLMGVEGVPTVNPATGQPAAVVAHEHQEMLEAAGLTVWDPLGYLILTAAAAIRRSAHMLMTTTAVDDMLKQLGKAFPALTDAARMAGLNDVLTLTLRELLGDGVSVRNLRRIVELLLRGEADRPQASAIDRVRLVRTGLGDQITRTLARNTETLVVYILAPEIDDAVAGRGRGVAAGWSDETVTEELCDAVYDELLHLPRTAQIPIVLTSGTLRGTIRARLRHEFPELAVVGYDEVPYGFNIQPVARISWRA